MTLRPPKQARSRRTLDRLVEAAMDLMADQGVEGTSVAEVVNAAQSSVGSFYARFEGKDDFVGYLEARVWADATQRWDQAVADIQGRQLSAQDLVTGVIRLLIDTRKADLERRRALGTASGSAAHAEAFHVHVLDGILELLRPFQAEFRHPDPDKAIRIGYAVIAGALDQLPALRAAAPGGTESLVGEMARMFLAYLGSDADSGAVKRVGHEVPETVRAGTVPSGPVTTPLPTGAEAPPIPAVVQAPAPPMIPEPQSAPLAGRPEAPTPLMPQREEDSVLPAPVAEASDATAPEAMPSDTKPPAESTEKEDARERVDFFDVWG